MAFGRPFRKMREMLQNTRDGRIPLRLGRVAFAGTVLTFTQGQITEAVLA